ncbi:MAG: methyltransferase domain-containing protein [Chloroflexi bacterium]|nr:methyltransferase domain-containing protein [Chloroflexota bacterium]
MDKTGKVKKLGVALALGAGVVYWTWRQSQRAEKQAPEISTAEAQKLLEQAAPLLRLPSSPDHEPEVLPDGAGLRCPVTGQILPYREGILWLLEGDERERTITQQALDTSLSAWAYDAARGWIVRALGALDFDQDAALTQERLRVEAGDVVLDLACGHGNFTVEWAKRAGDDGLILGLDYSPAMLEQAVYHIRRWGLRNVLLIHGDAHALPFADGALPKINCSGGFHQFPDLPQALREIARVSAPGAVLTTSTFAEGKNDPRAGIKRWFKRTVDLHFVPLVKLGEQLTALGYKDYTWSLLGGWFGYAAAIKT